MAQTTKSANSASSNEKKSVGRPNQSVAAIREQYNLDQERSKANFASAEEALKRFRDPNQNSSVTLNAYDRETIRNYLQNPAQNEVNLRKAAKYLYYRSPILYRLVHFYAGMWDLRCRDVQPPYDLVKGLDGNALKQFNDTLNQLDIYNLADVMYPVFLKTYLEGVCYFIWFRDDTGAIPYILDADECRIEGKYMTGSYGYSVDMSKWRSQQRQNLIEWLGSPLKEMYNEFLSSGLKWVHMPDEYAGVMLWDESNPSVIVPPFAYLFQQISSLLDLTDIQNIASEMDIFKLLILPMKTISSSKTANDFEIDPKLMEAYFDRLVQGALPPYISAAPVPGDGVDVVDFSASSTDKDIDRVQNAQNNIFATSGGGAVLNATKIDTNAAFKAWLQHETNFALSPLIGQVNGFTNMMLGFDLSKPCQVKHLKVSTFTREDEIEKILTANQHGFSSRLVLGTLYGRSEKATLASLHFEQEVLGLQDLMVFPLQSSYTQSNTGEEKTDPVNGGRPESDDIDLSPEGEKSRNR